jgi:hypothetical protein
MTGEPRRERVWAVASDPALLRLIRDVASDARIPTAILQPEQAPLALELALADAAPFPGVLVGPGCWPALRDHPVLREKQVAVLVAAGVPEGLPPDVCVVSLPCSANQLTDVMRWLASGGS